MISLARLATILAGSTLLAASANAQESFDRRTPVVCDHVPLDIADARDLVDACSDSLSSPNAPLDDEVDARLLRAEAYGMLGEWNEALADADRAVELAPGVPWGYWLRGRIALVAGDAEQAYQDFDAILTATDSPPRGFFLGRGTASVVLGDDRAAILDFDSYLQIEPDSVEALILRAQALERRGGYELALTDLDAAVNVDGAAGMPYLARADTYFRIGQCGFAEADYQRAAAFAETAEVAAGRLATLRTDDGRANCLNGLTSFIRHSYQLTKQWRKVEGGEECAQQLAIETYHYPAITIAPAGSSTSTDDPNAIRGQIEERRDGAILVYEMRDGRREDLLEIRLDDLYGFAEITSLKFSTLFASQRCRYYREES